MMDVQVTWPVSHTSSKNPQLHISKCEVGKIKFSAQRQPVAAEAGDWIGLDGTRYFRLHVGPGQDIGSKVGCLDESTGRYMVMWKPSARRQDSAECQPDPKLRGFLPASCQWSQSSTRSAWTFRGSSRKILGGFRLSDSTWTVRRKLVFECSLPAAATWQVRWKLWPKSESER